MSFEVSQSKIKNWRNCRKAYDYKYVQRLTKKYKPMPFLRGDIVHQMLEAHYRGEDPWKPFKKIIAENEKVLRTHVEEYGDLEGLIKVLMKGYFAHYENEKIKPLEIEKEFKVEIAKGIILNGKMDLIARHQGMKWMVEHKVHNIIPNNSVVPYNNIQSSLYVWAYNRENKKPLDGIMWNYMLGKPLSTPQLLKDGTMSRRSSNTTWPVYRQALKDAKLDPKDYLDMKEQLKGNEEAIYQRQLVPTNQHMMNSTVEDSITTAREIQKLGGKDTTRNLGKHCDYCEFKTLCLAQLKGLDDNFILKSDFKKREKDGHEKNRKKD